MNNNIRASSNIVLFVSLDVHARIGIETRKKISTMFYYGVMLELWDIIDERLPKLNNTVT